MSYVLLILLTLGARGDDPVTFRQGGKEVKRLTRAELEKAATPQAITVWEPHESREVTYEGFPFQKLLSAAYGESWKKTEEILFTCADGYQPSLPVTRFLETPAYLVYERKGSDFELVNRLQGEEEVRLGPYYLVWDNLKDPQREAKGASGWPYQVVGVDLVKFAERFPRMAPPPRASAKVIRGFTAFREHCFTCHSVNGDGGLKGIELNYPVSVTEFIKRKWLLQWILDPGKIRLKTTMPALNPALKDRLKIAEDIVAYLEAMAKRKQKPPAT